MTSQDMHARISLLLNIRWTSPDASHLDRFFIYRLNPWRDIFPGSFFETVWEDTAAGPVSRDIAAGALVPEKDDRLIYRLGQDRLYPELPFDRILPGRFYPKGMVRGIPGIFRANAFPFRCVEKEERMFTGDFNHPMADIPFSLTLNREQKTPGRGEHGGSCTDFLSRALEGPGMQAAMPEGETLFFETDTFNRRDDSPDGDFYAKDRLVHHIDGTARQHLTNWYKEVIPEDAAVLDLMAGWDSHLPPSLEPSRVTGVGMNAAEMAANPALGDFLVQDLNRDAVLPLEDAGFDAVVCSLSVEYLIRPVAVFREVLRVLKPGGVFAVSFSNRWFPEKAIHIWPRLHEFERMGLVLEYFRRARGFSGFSTYSLRGYPRPLDDRYFPQHRFSDPLFGVTGIRT